MYTRLTLYVYLVCVCVCVCVKKRNGQQGQGIKGDLPYLPALLKRSRRITSSVGPFVQSHSQSKLFPSLSSIRSSSCKWKKKRGPISLSLLLFLWLFPSVIFRPTSLHVWTYNLHINKCRVYIHLSCKGRKKGRKKKGIIGGYTHHIEGQYSL